jgi:hypothetical protein
MFCLPVLVTVLIFCVPELIFSDTQGVGSCFHVLRARTHFRQYRGRPFPFSYFALTDTFSVVQRASGAIFMRCAPRHVFSGAEGFGFRFQVLRSRTCFRRFRGRRVPFSCFALPNTFSAVRRSSGPVFMFFAPGHVSTVRRASGPVFIFCAPRLVFGDSEGVRSRFHVLLSRTRFRRFEARRVPFSCFALPDSFSPFSRVSGSVFMFCVPVLIFGGFEGVGSRFHLLRPRTHFRR